MKKKIMKMSLALLIVVSTVLVTTVFATSGLDRIKKEVKPSTSNPATPEVNSIASDLLGILQFLAIALLLAGIMIGGIMMIMNAGNPQKKADAKNAMIAVIAGSALIFVPTKIVELLLKIGEGASAIK